MPSFPWFFKRSVVCSEQGSRTCRLHPRSKADRTFVILALPKGTRCRRLTMWPKPLSSHYNVLPPFCLQIQLGSPEKFGIKIMTNRWTVGFMVKFWSVFHNSSSLSLASRPNKRSNLKLRIPATLVSFAFLLPPFLSPAFLLPTMIHSFPSLFLLFQGYPILIPN